MKGSALAGAVLAASVQTASASTPDGVVMMDIGRRQPHPRLTRRSDTDQTTIINNVTQGGYFIECKIGTPSQSLTLQLDTGSSDVWVPSSSASVCEATRSNPDGCSLGSFSSSSSSSFTVVGENEFQIEYVDGSESRGDYFTDTFTIGGSKLTNLTMGLGSSTDIPFGLVGVGYKTNEAIVGTEQSLSAAYPNLPVVMTNEGVIKSVAYSLWLNDLDSSSGQILFGGIDTEKYEGDLTAIDIYRDSSTGTFSSFLVALTGLEAVSSSGHDTLTSHEFPIPVVLDSGTTLSYLPQDLAQQVWTEVGATYSSTLGIAVVPCDLADGSGYFSFGFAGPDGPTIKIGMDELVLDLVTEGANPTFATGVNKGRSACEFGIQNMSSDPFLLGDTFLRSAYVVYDLVNNQIGIAATDFNATKSNIVAFSSSGAPIPSATTAPNQSEVTASTAYTTPTYAASSGFQAASTATPVADGSNSSGSSSSSSSSSSSKSAAPGGAASIPMDLVRVMVVSACFFMAGGVLLV